MAECNKDCGSCESAGTCDLKLKERLSSIKHKVMVLSGKGGVGKSSVSVNLAVSLAMNGMKVGLLDIDFHGPSVPTMLGLKKITLNTGDDGIIPAEVHNLKVVSISMLLEKDNDNAIIWRGPMKAGVLKQLLENVNWGELDYLIMDFPPGTGDEALSACQLVSDADGGIIVTTPQEVSLSDCRRCISFCRQLGLPVLGVLENMSGFVCPKCGEIADIFGCGGGEDMAKSYNVPFLGKIPLDPELRASCDSGHPFIYHSQHKPAALAFAAAVDKLTVQIEGN
ncbi:MAG: Mrp/NBP35 family ATP-binding protein [Victivallales bacterium]